MHILQINGANYIFRPFAAILGLLLCWLLWVLGCESGLCKPKEEGEDFAEAAAKEEDEVF